MKMKMIIAVLNADDSAVVSHNLMKNGYSMTKLATTGGFLRAGNVTILVGVEEDKLQGAIDIIKENSHSRKQIMAPSTEPGMNLYPTMPIEVVVGGAAIFVLDVDHFEKV